MSTEDLKSFDPFVDERDPFTENRKAGPASHASHPGVVDVGSLSDPDAEDDDSDSLDPIVDKKDSFKKTGNVPASHASHPRASTGKHVDVGSLLDSKVALAEDDDGDSLDRKVGKKGASTKTGKAIPASHASHPRSSTGKHVDAGSFLDPKIPFAEEDDIGSLDPFEYEDHLAEAANVGSTLDQIHVRIQQRNGRKTLTTLQGLNKDIKIRKLLKAFKKEFACNGSIVEDETAGTIIQLQGDHRYKIKGFLVEQGVPPLTVRVHGF